MARILKTEQKCDIVICLSHLGFKYKDEPNKPSDLLLAKKTKDIDLILGGHTHTFLDKPVIEKNLLGNQVLINQVGCYGLNLGRIDLYLTNDKKIIADGKSIIV
jgi:5'-nucleotidase